jgi:multidrug efflux pump subunit AcrA (membrane-fusion protein)
VQLELERAQSRLESAQRELDFDRQEAQANLEIAQIQLEQLKRQSPPPKREDIAIQEKQVELAELQVERLSQGVDPLLENDVARAELQVQKLNAAIEDAQIIAPFDGELMSVSLVAGQAVEAYRPAAVIADTSNLEVSADLISSQLDGLAEGMPAEVVLVSRPGVVLAGEVRRLPFPYGSGSSGTTVEDLDKSTRVALKESAAEAGYQEGDLVRVTVELERKDNVLWLPPQALRNFDGRMFAVIQEGEAQRRVDVKVGIQTSERVEIEEGLEEGQIVLGQ